MPESKNTLGRFLEISDAADRNNPDDVLKDSVHIAKDTGVISTSDGESAWTDQLTLAQLTAALSAIAALTPAADKMPYYTGASTAALATLTSFIRTVLDDADAATALATLGAVSRIGGGLETIKNHNSMGAAETFDLADGNYHYGTLDANCTFTFSGATNGKLCVLTMALTQDGTGSRTGTWPGSVGWATGSAPTLHTAAAAVDFLQFITIDGGTAWVGFHLNPVTSTADHNHTGGGDGGDLDAPVIDGYAIFNEESAPSTPASATVALYAKSDGLLYSKDDAGTETLVSGGSGGGGTAVGATHQRVTRTAGSYTPSTGVTTMTELSSGLRLTIPAVAGDILQIGLSCMVNQNAVAGDVAIDSATIVSGSIVHQVTPGSRGVGHGYSGATGILPFGGTLTYVVQSGDISGGNVTVSPTYIASSSNTLTVYATTSYALSYWVVNLGH